MGIHKGILTLITAMEDALPLREDMALVIAGNPTSHTAAIESRIRETRPEIRPEDVSHQGIPG